MDLNQPGDGSVRISDINATLRSLAELKSIPDECFVGPLAEIINEPTSIDDTNSFASLLVKMGSELFISPLINSISKAIPGESSWLADYMYALNEILMDREEYYPADEIFVHLLGKWLFSTGGGEISWKAGTILAEIKNEATRDYLIRGAADPLLFHGTRIACIRGIINHYRGDAQDVISTVIDDSDRRVKDAALDAQQYLKSRETE